jgi:threonylcarbamoyladenosine tRNA methylthiotransferase MtaB
MTIAFHTLGCKLNFAETSTIRRAAEERGYKVVSFESVADIYVINTCSVTEKTDKKCRNSIRRAHRLNALAKVIVTGCFAELKPKEITNIEGVNLVIGNHEKAKFLTYIESLYQNEELYNPMIDVPSKEEFFHAFSMGDRTRSFLKVQDGCNYFCSYCTIPFARGRSRNAPINELVKEASYIARNGVLEIVLTGINIGDFGHSTNESFMELLKSLNEIKPIKRYRISSIEPELLTSDIIRFIAASNSFMPHFHIPLQSGSNTILKKMNRKYTSQFFKKKIDEIHSCIPHAGIGVDVITGFPGESDFEFSETLAFLKELDIAYIHVFSYSERDNTVSAKLPNKISTQIINERSKVLHILASEKKEKFYEKYVGKSTLVLVEGKNSGNTMHGFTGNYIKVEMIFDKQYLNKIVPVTTTGFNKENMSLTGYISLL